MYTPLGSPGLDLVLYKLTQLTRWVWAAHLFSHSLLFEMQEWLNDIIFGRTLQNTESTQCMLAVFVWGQIFANHILQWWASLVVQMVKNMPTIRKIPWRRKWQPTPRFLPGEPHGQGYSPWGHKESDMIEELTFCSSTEKSLLHRYENLWKQ